MPSEPTTSDLLAEVERLDKSAMPGPWKWYSEDGMPQLQGQTEHAEMNPVIVGFVCESCRPRRGQCLSGSKEDHEFIARARTLLPLLAERLREMEADERRLNWLDEHCAFVADPEFAIGPFKVGQLREMADEGMRQSAALVERTEDGHKS